MKVKAYVQFGVLLIRVTIARELNSYARLSERLLSPPNRRWVVPLYKEADAQQPLESGRLIRVSGLDSKQYLPYTTSLL